MNRFLLNVALAGRHYCRIELPETSESEAIKKAASISKAFGVCFECDLTCWNDTGRRVSLSVA